MDWTWMVYRYMYRYVCIYFNYIHNVPLYIYLMNAVTTQHLYHLKNRVRGISCILIYLEVGRVCGWRHHNVCVLSSRCVQRTLPIPYRILSTFIEKVILLLYLYANIYNILRFQTIKLQNWFALFIMQASTFFFLVAIKCVFTNTRIYALSSSIHIEGTFILSIHHWNVYAIS